MKIVILGGTGFVGSYVVRRLSSEHDVTVFHRGVHESDAVAQVRHIHGEFAELSRCKAELIAGGVDVVLDMVPYIDKNGHGVRHFRGHADRAVVITSGDVYRAFARLWRSEPGPPDPVPLSEDAALRTTAAPDVGADDEIDYDNVDVERAVATDAVLPTTVLRLPATYGPGDPQRRLGAYLAQMFGGAEVIEVGEHRAAWRWSRGFVENVAAAIALAVTDERARGRVYNVGSSAPTEREWLKTLGDVAGWKGEIVVVPDNDVDSRIAYEQDLVMDTTRIRGELGYVEVVDERDGIARTVAWESEQSADPTMP